MKKGFFKKLLLIFVLLFPLFVFAESKDDSVLDAFFTEFAASLHMTLFVLWPLAAILSKEKSEVLKKIGLIFLIRAILLIIITPVYPGISYVDVIILFVGAFTIGPIGFRKFSNLKSSSAPSLASFSSVAGGVVSPTYPSSITCPKCGNTMAYGNKTCVKCGYDFSSLYNNSDLSKVTTGYFCSKCGKESKEGNKFCSECGGEIVSKTNINGIDVIYDANKDISSGTPINKNEFNTALFESTQDKTLLKMINDSMSKNIENKGKTLTSIETRKILMTLLYSIVLALIVTLYAAYHTNLFLMIVVILLITIIYICIVRSYGITKYLMKEIKSRPDEKIDYVVFSTMSGAITGGFGFKFIRIIILVLFLSLSVLIFSEPHYIYEKDPSGNGYVLRYYTLGILKNERNISIPDTYKGESVIGIRGDVFKNVYSVEKVELPDTIVEIRGGAFQNCYNLESINLPPKITEIHGSTFENCYSLKKIVIPEGVTRIGGSAFRECNSLSDVTIPRTVTEIGSSAFRNTAISSVCISRNTSVNERAFKDTYPSIAYYEDGCKSTGDDFNYGGYNNY